MSFDTQQPQPKKVDATKDALSKAGEKPSVNVSKPVDIAAFERQADKLFDVSKIFLKGLPYSLQISMRDNILRYLRTSVARYDSDGEAGLSEKEFVNYKRDMLQKVNEIIARYAQSAEARDKQKQGATEAQGAVKKSAEIQIKDTNFNETNLQTPQGIQQELAKFNAQNADMHKEIGGLSESIGNFQQACQRFEEGKKKWSVFLRGSPLVDDPETEQLKTQLANLKQTLDAKIKQLDKKKVALMNYGMKLNFAGDKMKRQKIDERDSKLREIDAQDAKVGKAKKKNEAQYRALETQQQKLYGQREAMADYHDGLVQKLEGITQSKDKVRVQAGQIKIFDNRIESALVVIDQALAKNPVSPQKEQLEEKKKELLGHKTNIGAATSQTQGAETQLDSAKQALQGKRGETDAKLLTLDSFLTQKVRPGLKALSGSIQALEIAKLKNGTQREQTEAQYAEILQNIDTVDAAVDNNVLDNNLVAEQALSSIITQRKSLDDISIKRPNLWTATGGLALRKFGDGVGKIGEGGKFVLGKIGEGWEKIGKLAGKIPVVGVVLKFPCDLSAGVSEGAGELINGVTTMVAHPVDTIVGIGSLIGRNPQTGEWSLSNAGNSWREMGKALIAYENFEKGEVGKGVGKAALNVLLTATGVGAAVKGVQGSSIAYSVATKAGEGVARASLKAVGTGARLFAGEFSNGLARLPGEAVSTAGKLLRAPRGLLENMKLGTSGKLGKEISEATGELSKASKQLEGFTIGGKKVSEMESLVGKTSAELKKLSPDDFVKAGINNTSTIREFLEYRKARAKGESLQGSIQALSHKKDIIQIAPELEAAFKLKGRKLKSFIEEFNKKNSTGFAEKSFQKLRETKDGIIAFNAKGALQLFENEITLQSSRSRAVLGKYLEKRFAHLDEATRTSKISEYQKSVELITSEKVQKDLSSLYKGLEGVPDEASQRLRAYTERHALEQHFENPEKYVSHGFDHSLNVKRHMENALKNDPKIVETMMKKYGLSKAESEMMMQMIAVYHDFGYPEVGKLGKALHGVTGAEVAATDEFVKIMKDVIRTKGTKFDELMFDFKNGILYHSADKVEIYREVKIKIAHGEFIIDTDNIVHVYNRFSKSGRKEKIQIVCTEAIETKMKAELTKGGIAYDTFEFRRPAAGETTAEGKFRGRTVDLEKAKDAKLGIQYREVSLVDDPMNYMIRLTDNFDMTVERFSPLQRTEAFKEIYMAFAPIEGQSLPTGRLLSQLELCEKGHYIIEEILGWPIFRKILEDFKIDTKADIREIIKTYKSKLIDSIISKPKYAAEIKTFKNRIKEIGMEANSESIQHFGGCEAIKDVQLAGRNLTVTVYKAKFDELNRTTIAEVIKRPDSHAQLARVEYGEYQIWRLYEASQSLGSKSDRIKIRVADEHGKIFIDDFGKYFDSDHNFFKHSIHI